MIELKRILCPTDFSPFAFRAADYAVALARRYRSEVHFVHVLPETLLHPNQYPYVSQPILPESSIRDEAAHRLELFARACRAADVSTRSTVLDGSPATRVLDAAEKDASDIICMGTHGRDGFERLVLGSVAEKVLRKASCPVLTVSDEGAEHPRRTAAFVRIVCAIDFEPLSLAARDYAFSLVSERRGRVALVHVLEVGDRIAGDERRALEADALSRLGLLVPDDVRTRCDVTTRVAAGKPYREVLAIAEEQNADLIVLGVRGRNPLDRLFFGSTADHVVRGAACPALTVRASN